MSSLLVVLEKKGNPMEGIVQCPANYVPLSPISFLERAAFVYHQKVSIIYGTTSYTWRETHERCVKLASALSQLGVSRGDIVAILAPNVPEVYELHFAVPMAGAVLSALNTKFDASLLASIIEQLEAKAIFADSDYAKLVLDAFELLSHPPQLVLIAENNQEKSSSLGKTTFGRLHYNELLSIGQFNFNILRPTSELDPISVNYTSGSTGKPKGVVYSHRAAYLNSFAAIFRCDVGKMPVFLWTVDMFRCNGWSFIWAVAALGGTNICLRNTTAKAIFDSICIHGVTHLCGPPTILSKIAGASAEDHQPLPCNVDVIVAGVLPLPHVMTKVKDMGFSVTCAYGMTEALGLVTTDKLWEPEGSLPPLDEDVRMAKRREGIHNLLMEGVDVKDPVTMASVPPDGQTIGEVMFRSNTMMLGYLKNLEATGKAFKDGWYRTGDIGVRNEDGSIQMKDRAVDAISYGEQIVSTLKIEAVLISHPMILDAAVVGRPEEPFGDRPFAFVKLKEGCHLTAEEVIKFCANKLPQHMTPQTAIFGDLPVNSTGKIQKFVLRDKAKAMGTGRLPN